MDNGTTTPIKNQEPARKGGKSLKIGIIGVSLFAVIASILVALSFFKPAPPESQPQSTSAESSNEKKDDEALARAIEPCVLLTDAERAKFNLGTGEADDKHLRGCSWKSPDKLYVDVKIYPLYGLDRMPQWPESPPKPITVGSHNAQTAAAPPDSIAASLCEIDIAVGPTQKATVRLSANGTYNEAPEKYCDIVKQVAELVEPKLP